MKDFKKVFYGIEWNHRYVEENKELLNKGSCNCEREDTCKECEDEWAYDHGIILPDKSEILIWSKLSDSRQELTLLHEHIHLVDFENDLTLTEGQTKSLASGLYAMGYRLKE